MIAFYVLGSKKNVFMSAMHEHEKKKDSPGLTFTRFITFELKFDITKTLSKIQN